MLSEGPLLGRDVELAKLRALLHGAACGRGGLVLLTGEPGIGKTYLADALVREAERAGHVVSWGRAWEAGGAPPLWPWVEALSGVAKGVAADAARELLDVIGALREARGSGTARQDLVRFELFERVRAALERACERCALVLVLDDLHVADEGTLDLLERVARTLRTLPLCVIATARDEDEALTQARRERIGRIAREGTRLTLRRLARDEVTALARTLCGEVITGASLDRLWALTEGNPLYVEGCARAFRATRSLAVPQDLIAAVVHARLAPLSSDTRARLEAACIEGRSFHIARVARLTAALPARVQDDLVSAMRAGLVRELSPGAWEFTHILVRDALYGELEASRRGALHAQLLDALEAGELGSSVAPAELAHHAFAALPHVPLARVLALAEDAARAARAMCAFDSEIELRRRVLSALDAHGGDDRARAETWLCLGEAQSRYGDRAESRESARRAQSLAKRLGDRSLAARAALTFGVTIMPGLVDGELVSVLEDALVALDGHEPALRCRVMARLAAARQPSLDPEQPMALAREAIALSRTIVDDDTRLYTLHHAISALLEYSPVSERAPLNEELVGRALRAGDRVLALQAWVRLAVDRLESGDLVRLTDCARAARALGDEIRHPAYQIKPRLLESLCATLRADFARCEVLDTEARELVERAADPFADFAFRLHRFGWLRAAHRDDEALRVAESFERALVVAMPGSEVWLRLMPALAYAQREEADAVRAWLDGVPLDGGHLAKDLMGLAWMSLATACARDVPRARVLLELLAGYAGRVATTGVIALGYEGPVARFEGLLAGVLDEHDRALACLEGALEEVSQLGLPAHAATLRYELACARLSRSAREDADVAAGLLQGVLHDAERLSLPGLALRARAQLELVGQASVRDAVSPRAISCPVLTREGEYWSVQFEGALFRVKHSRGLRMLAELVTRPRSPIAALELAHLDREGVDVGDAGTALDGTAIASYHTRLRELGEDLESAQAHADLGRTEAAQREIDALLEELARGVGLRGEGRRVGSALERARVNVQRRLKDAIHRLGELDPALGRHLDEAVRTGSYCVYRP